MKKLIVFFVFIFFGCTSKINDEINPQDNYYLTFTNRVYNGLLSKSSFNLGIEKIIPELNKNGEMLLKFKASPKSFVNKELDMSLYTFKQKKFDNYYELTLTNLTSSKESFSLIFYPKSKEYFVDGKFVVLKDLYFKNFQLVIMAILFDEVNNSSANFSTLSFADFQSDKKNRNTRQTKRVCEMSAISFQEFRSSARSHAYNLAAHFIDSHPGTTVVGQDSGCVWGDFLCVHVIHMEYNC